MASILEQLKTVMSEEEILAFDEREFKAVVGLSPAAFVKLLPHFAQSYETLQQEAEASRERPRQRQVGGGRKATLKSMASKQGFILHYFKRYDTLDDVGIADDYSVLELHIPYKKPRKSQANPTPSLSDQQKATHRAVSQVRIVVEHVLASMKHWTILTTKFRNRLAHLADDVILALAGLHNFLLSP